MFTNSRSLAVALSASALLFGATARAQDTAQDAAIQVPPMFNPPPPDLGPPSTSGTRSHMANRGLQVGVRTGYGGGAGVVYSGLTVHEASSGGIPVIVDLGARILPELYAGIYGGWASIFTKNNAVSCPDDLDCKTQQWRFGVQFDFHYIPTSKLDPYIGLGGGYEILHTHITGAIPIPTALGTIPGTTDTTITDRGWEFANLTAGFDARFNRAVALGPFISGSISEYGVHSGTETASIMGTQVVARPVPTVSHGLHELLFVGVRATFNP
jgi:hypothetical protein